MVVLFAGSLCVQEFTTFDEVKTGDATLLQEASGMCITRKTVGYNALECGLFCRSTVGFPFLFFISFPSRSLRSAIDDGTL